MRTIVLLIALSTLPAEAKILNCNIDINLNNSYKAQINTNLDKKTLIGSTPEVRAYITEKADHNFSIEGYLSDLELRIYGAGVLRNRTDRVSSSLWDRDRIIDINCIPAN